MKLKTIFILLFLIPIILFATSSTTRNLNIDGNVSGQKGASNGSNGSSWELNEVLSGKSGVTWYLSWDNNNLYVGREGGNNGEPVLIYIQAEFSGSVYTDNSSGISYDGTRGDFPTTGTPNWGTGGGVNFVAYIKSTYDEFRTWNGSSWSSANISLVPHFHTQGEIHNMEVSIPWNSVTQGNGTPTYIRIVFFHTNGNNSGGAYVYGASPNNSNTPSDGNQTIATFRSWWGGYPITAGIEPNAYSDNPLPVQINSFNFLLSKDEVKIIWTTASEIQNSGWEIQRAKIDKETNKPSAWQTIGFVKGAGISNSPKEYSFVDRHALYGEYAYRLKQIDFDGANSYSSELRVFVGEKPKVYDLKSFPNPLNPNAKIRYELPESGNVNLSIYDLTGRLISTLVDDFKSAGIYEVEFDGSRLASGIYISILQANGKTITRKMQLIK